MLRGTGLVTGISVFQKYHNTLCFFSKILHNHCFQIFLGLIIVSREIENNGGTTKSIMVFLWLNRRKVLHDDVILLQQFYQNPSVCCFLVQMRAVFQTSVRLTNLSEEAKTKRILVVVVNCRWEARVAPW